MSPPTVGGEESHELFWAELRKMPSMAYPIFDLDIAKPLPQISLSDEDTGVAILLRREGRPINFFMEPLPADREMKLKELDDRIREKAKADSLTERRRADQRTSDSQSPFPSLTIAICTKDRPSFLARCLEFLGRNISQSSSLPNSIEILVVDNAPSDTRNLDVVSSFSGVRYVCEPLAGLNFARNRALNEASGQLLAYLDDDVVVDYGWLSGLREAWSHNPTAAAFTGLVLPYELVTEAQIMFEQRGGWRRGFDRIRYTTTLPGHSLYPAVPAIMGTGANMAFQRDILRKLGGFDEALDTGAPLPGGGDLDIFYRVIRGGYSLQYEPAFLVFHQHRRELTALRDQYWSWGISFMAFVSKSFRTDPVYRSKLIRVVVWWFAKELWQLQKSLLGRHPLPPKMILAELLGGIMGVLGGYARSKRHVEKLQARNV